MANPFVEFGNLVPDVVSSKGTDADQRKRETRAKLYRQMPNDNMLATPLTKIVMSNKGESVQNPKYEWAMEAHDDLYVNPTGAYTDASLTTAVTNTATAAGTTIYLNMAADSARQFVVHEHIQLRALHATDDSVAGHEAAVHAIVTAITVNGASSYLTLTTLEADTAKALYYAFQTGYLAYASPIAPAMPEGSQLPWSRYREATEHFNYCQILMAGLGLTGTELSNAQRFDEDTYNRYWRQVHDRFNKYVERVIMWGIRDKRDATVDMGAGGQTVEQYSTGGLYWMLGNLSDNPSNIINLRNVTKFEGMDFTGKSFDEGFYDFLKLYLLNKSKKSGMRKQMYLSATAKQYILNMFESLTSIQVDPFTKNKWGFFVTKVHGLNCELEMIQHQDLSCNPAWERVAFIIEPEKLQWRSKKGRDMTVIRSIKDLKKKTNVEDGFAWRDATKEGIFMDGGLLVDDIDGMGIITGLGRDFATS